jgi:hypothetical protein
MKRLICISASLLLACSSFAQKPDQAAMMKAWQAYMTPSPVHKMIAKSDGKWNAATTMWMDPSAPPMTSKGTCTNKMILNGLYQESTFKGTMMGKSFEGRGLLAYDNAKKVFISTWVDNMGSGVMVMQGTWDEATKTTNYTGKSVDPMTGQDVDVRETYQIVSDNHHTLTMYMKDPTTGTEMKTMQIEFTR